MRIRSNVLYVAVMIAASVAAATFAAAPASAGAGVDTSANTSANTSAVKPSPAPEFQNIDTWINSEPLKIEQLRGKVVLVDFWTYTCSNCLNHLPYVKDWNTKYKNQGLVVVGVHTPEFAFEKSTKNVQAAVKKLQIEHAVAQDNSYGTWKAFNNQYWPAIYLIDKQGNVVYSHFGEGRYADTEKKILALLAQS